MKLNDWSTASGTVRRRTYWLNFFRPASPLSCINSLMRGAIIERSCMIIDAVMYGPIPSITIENRESPPPESALNTPKNWFPLRNWLIRSGSTPGTGIAASMRNIKSPNTTKSTLIRSDLSVMSVLILLKNEFIVFVRLAVYLSASCFDLCLCRSRYFTIKDFEFLCKRSCRKHFHVWKYSFCSSDKTFRKEC